MTLSHSELDGMVSAETGEVDRRIYTDQEIFDLEMKEIFARAWLFVCHESQIRKPGDFVETPMGGDEVLVVRQRDGSIKAMINTCLHRGNAVCRADEGNTRNFMCTYHGWTYGLDGSLVGVPGADTFYKGDLDRSRYGLRQVAQLDTYEGFVFATMDPSAPPLPEFLGETGRLGLKLVAAQGDMEVVPGVQKWVIDCNWKFAVDNSFDFYHPLITHLSAFETSLLRIAGDRDSVDSAGLAGPSGEDLEIDWAEQFVKTIAVLGEYGHAIHGSEESDSRRSAAASTGWRQSDRAKEMLPGVASRIAGHPNIFPHLFLLPGVAQISLRVPRTPTRTEIWWYSFRDADAAPEVQAARLRFQNHIVGPAGLLEQEDGENWVQSTMSASGGTQMNVPHLLKMGLGHGEVIREDGLARIEGNTNEHAQLWTYLAWKSWLTGASWDKLKELTTPGDRV